MSSPLHFNHRICRPQPLAVNFVPRESPNSVNATKNVVVVMDGLKEFSMEPLKWALDNLIIDGTGGVVVLLGTMPWLNIPLSSKTWRGIWAMELEDLSMEAEKNVGKNDFKHQKLQTIVQLCKEKGVRPRIEVAMGYPLRLVVVEKITGLHATWVVFDRHQRKDREFYARKIPCNMVMMNGNQEVDMIKSRPLIDNGENTQEESPLSWVTISQVMIRGGLRGGSC